MTAPLSAISLIPGTILGDEVYTRIGDAILDGTLAPGQQLKDVELASQLGVSRTPVREALQRLERFGLVEVAVGRYTRVSVPDDRLRAETAAFTAYFVGNALRMALPQCDDATLAELVKGADAVTAAAAADDPLTMFDASVELYTKVTRATGNDMFIGVVREASLAIRRNLRGWNPFVERPLANRDAFRRLREAIASRDGAAAEQAFRFLHDIA